MKRSKLKRWWSAQSAALLDAAIPPAFAFAFWAIILMLIMLAVATAAKKGNPFTDFFTAFGAVGQVVFAYMVWRLGREQFMFTKRATERQMRIDTYTVRKDNLDKFLNMFEMSESLTGSSAGFTKEFIDEWYNLLGDCELVFSDQVIEPFLKLVVALDELQVFSAFRAETALIAKGDVEAEKALLSDHWKKVQELYFGTWHAMYRESSIASPVLL